jgi:hypothetical protein
MGGAIELAEGDAMIYRSVAGLAEGQLGLRLGLESSLSGLCVRSGVMLESADTDTGPRVDREACQRMGLRSMLVVRSATTRAASASSRRWHVSPIVSGVRSGCCWAVRKTARYTAGTGTS